MWLVVLLHVCTCAAYYTGTVPPDEIYSAPPDSCDAIRNAGTIPAQITSPGYPDNYPDSTDCGTLIYAEVGQQIYLEFANFTTESCCDYVNVYDGRNQTAPSLGPSSGRFAGSLGNQISRSTTRMISSGNAMYITFHSDSSVTQQGYSAYYRISDGSEILDYEREHYEEYASGSAARAGSALIVATIAAYYLY